MELLIAAIVRFVLDSIATSDATALTLTETWWHNPLDNQFAWHVIDQEGTPNERWIGNVEIGLESGRMYLYQYTGGIACDEHQQASTTAPVDLVPGYVDAWLASNPYPSMG